MRPSPGRPPRRTAPVLVDGKRLLITGVLTPGSIAYAVAREALDNGAEVVLTGFGLDRLPGVGVLAQGADRRAPAVAGEPPRLGGHPRLRRPGGLAGLRLDGGMQGGAGVGHPLPGPRP